MSTNIHQRSRRWRLSLIPVVLLTFLAMAGTAFAAGSSCRTDPVLTLSNGSTVTLYADIATSISNVTRVQYDVHIPRGTSVTSITYPDGYGYLERVSWVADQPTASYKANVVVTTTTSGVGVSVFQSVQLSNSSYRSQTSSGRSGQTISNLIVIPH